MELPSQLRVVNPPLWAKLERILERLGSRCVTCGDMLVTAPRGTTYVFQIALSTYTGTSGETRIGRVRTPGCTRKASWMVAPR
ncbi:hypothetical protein DL771_006003 [Monosporascus sp. 5C6A]|nr:hypothetical protein DL771_006003 [Monosporascus sp. 5C6A]